MYVAKDVRRFLSTYASAAWLWTGRTGIIAGEAAAGLYGVRGIDPETPIEMIGRRRRERRGVIIREERIDPAEVSTVMNLPVTSLPALRWIWDVDYREAAPSRTWMRLRESPG